MHPTLALNPQFLRKPVTHPQKCEKWRIFAHHLNRQSACFFCTAGIIYIQQNSKQQVLLQRDPLQDIDSDEEEEGDAVQVASSIIVV
jgi:hypothetical protein